MYIYFDRSYVELLNIPKELAHFVVNILFCNTFVSVRGK